MVDTNQNIVPDFNVDDHIVSDDIWETIEQEITSVVAEIDAGTELTPQDVKRVRSLRNQIDDYVKSFNRAMVSAQKDYKASVQRMLDDLGYDRIESYIKMKRSEQTAAENERVQEKLDTFTTIVNDAVQNTTVVKDVIPSSDIVSLFYNRFEKLKSGAKSKMVSDWIPYRAVVDANLETVDALLQENPAIRILPSMSMTMKAITNFLRTGDDTSLQNITEVMKQDKPLLEQAVLRQQMHTKADALNMIKEVYESEATDTDKIDNISKIMGVASQLPH